jgi:hypothetical protein
MVVHRQIARASEPGEVTMLERRMRLESEEGGTSRCLDWTYSWMSESYEFSWTTECDDVFWPLPVQKIEGGVMPLLSRDLLWNSDASRELALRFKEGRVSVDDGFDKGPVLRIDGVDIQEFAFDFEDVDDDDGTISVLEGKTISVGDAGSRVCLRPMFGATGSQVFAEAGNECGLFNVHVVTAPVTYYDW